MKAARDFLRATAVVMREIVRSDVSTREDFRIGAVDDARQQRLGHAHGNKRQRMTATSEMSAIEDRSTEAGYRFPDRMVGRFRQVPHERVILQIKATCRLSGCEKTR